MMTVPTTNAMVVWSLGVACGGCEVSSAMGASSLVLCRTSDHRPRLSAMDMAWLTGTLALPNV